MKKLLQKDGLVLMLVSLLLLNTLPTMLNGLLMSMHNDFLTSFEMGFISVISGLICYGLFSIGLARYFKEKNILKGLYNGIPLIAIYILKFGLNSIFLKEGNETVLWLDIVLLIVYGLITGASLVAACAYNKNNNNKWSVIYILKILAISVLIYIIPELLTGLLANNISIAPFSIALISGTLYGLLVFVGVVVSLLLIEKELVKDSKLFNKSRICIVVGCFIVGIVGLILNGSGKSNNVELVDNLVGYTLAAGDYSFDEGDILSARDHYTNAKNYRCAYLYAIDNEYDITGCSGELLELFQTLNKEEALDILKQKVNDTTVNGYDLEALMQVMNDKKDKDISKITKLLINNLRFTRETVLPSDLTKEDKTKLKTDLEKYEKHLTVRKYIDIYVTWLNEGDFNSNVINAASKLANENPEEVSLQAEAINFFISAPKYVHGDSRVVDNFVELTKDDIKKQSKDKIVAYKSFIAYAYQVCDANNKVISFLEEFEPDKLNADMGAILLVSYKEKGEYEKADEIALKVLKEEEYNVEALTFLAIYRLQSNLDESIEYATKLAKIIETKKDNYLSADIALGMYRYYLTGYYEGLDSRFCPYNNFWRDMTEEQQAKLKENEILNGYLLGQGVNDENFEEFNKIADKYNYVAYFRYYRAIYYINHKEWQKAVDDLVYATETLGSKHPFMYSELGFAYEGVGDLKKSLEAFETADQYVNDLGLGYVSYNYNNIHSYFSVYINNAKHAMYESEGDHDEENN